MEPWITVLPCDAHEDHRVTPRGECGCDGSGKIPAAAACLIADQMVSRVASPSACVTDPHPVDAPSKRGMSKTTNG